MPQNCNYLSKKVIKRIASYLFLYSAFISIFYFYTYSVWICSKPIGLALVFLTAFGSLLLYALINHIIIRKIVGLKAIVIFETILFLLFMAVTICYADIENYYYQLNHN